MIGTPSYDGKLDVWYTSSLVSTTIMSIDKNINIIPIWVSFDALIQRARNDVIAIAKSLDVDDLVFIDGDIEWNPKDFFKLLDHPFDVVGGTYPKKSEKEVYVIRDILKPINPQTGLIEVSGLGTGFLRLSRNAINYLWDSSEFYIETKDNQERRMIFDVQIKNSFMHSEDIVMCDKLIQGGFTVFLDPTIKCNHIGTKKFVSNFTEWYSSLTKKPQL